MRTISKLLVMVVFLLVISSNYSCEDLTCNGMGTLSVENTSHSTVQKLMINGVNYGTLDPGETKETELNPGTYKWQLVGISGGVGCSEATAIVAECETCSFKCGG